MELYDQLKAEPDAAKQNELFKQIVQIAKEQLYTIGVSTQPDLYGIVKNNFHNVPQADGERLSATRHRRRATRCSSLWTQRSL